MVRSRWLHEPSPQHERCPVTTVDYTMGGGSRVEGWFTGSVHMPVHRQRRRRAWMIGAANVGPSRCLQAVGLECGLMGGECGPEPPRVGAECEPKMPRVCRSGCHCLQAATSTHRRLVPQSADPHLRRLPMSGDTRYH